MSATKMIELTKQDLTDLIEGKLQRILMAAKSIQENIESEPNGKPLITYLDLDITRINRNMRAIEGLQEELELMRGSDGSAS